MGIRVSADPEEWSQVFAGRESEYQERLIRVAAPEKQEIQITRLEPHNILTEPVYRQSSRMLGPVELLILDDVLFEDRTRQLILPFMEEYDDLAGKVEDEVEFPCNSALSSWLAYGHLLQDQMSLKGLYEDHALTRGLPMAFNLSNIPSLNHLFNNEWKYASFLIRRNITRFKKLYILVHRHYEVRRVQADFMKSEYGVSGIQRLRQKLIPDSPRRRLYITRAQNRKIINDDEVSFLLKSRRFERWEDTQLIGMSLPEQAAFFHSAEAIVSPQGSHLCNSFFCRPDVTLVELFKFSWIEASPLCALRAATLNARFGFTVDWAPWETYDQPLIHADIRVDLNKLEVLLNDLN